MTFNNIKRDVKKVIQIMGTFLLKYVRVTWERAVMDMENLATHLVRQCPHKIEHVVGTQQPPL